MTIGKHKNWKLTLVFLVLLWGFVGLQRNAILALAPFIMDAFSIDELQLALGGAVFAFTWAFGSLFSGFYTDKWGAKKIIVFSGIFSAVLGWLSGIVSSFAQLVAVRALLGIGEGSIFAPQIISARRMAPASMKAKLVSFFIGAFILIGMAMCVPLMVKIANDPNLGWRYGFILAAIPLLAVSLFIQFVMKEPKKDFVDDLEDKKEKISVKEIAKNSAKALNVWLAAFIQICSVARIFAILTFGLLFLSTVHGFSLEESALIGPAIIGEFIGVIAVGIIADKIGRYKILVVFATIASALFMYAFTSMPHGTSINLMTGLLFGVMLFGGMIGPLCLAVIPAESVAPKYAAGAIGLTNFLGEFIGGGILLLVIGAIAKEFGYQTAFYFTSGLMFLAFVLSLMLRPGKIKK